jgi:phytoene desaturase
MSFLPYLQAQFGTWHVEGGTNRIIQALLKVAEELGVRLRNNCEITGVYNSSIAIAGKWQTFDAVICNQDVLMAYQSLLPRKRCGEFRDAYLDRYKTSLSSFTLQLGVDRQYPQLAHHNVFFSDDHEQEFRQIITDRALPDEPTIHLTVSSRTEPRLAPEGCDNWCLRVDTPPMRSTIQWEDFAESLGNRIIERLEKRFGLGELSRHIIVRAHLTPADFRNRFLCFGGCLQGFASHNLRNALLGPSIQPPGMTGFFFAGASMRPGGGIPQVLENAENAVYKTLHHLRSAPKESAYEE